MGEALANPQVRHMAGEKALRETTLEERKQMSFYWLWSPINLQNAGVLYHCQQSHGGEKLVNANAQIVPLANSGFAPNQMVQMRTAGHDIVYKSDTRHAAFCSIALQGTK